MIVPEPHKSIEDQGLKVLRRMLGWGEARGEDPVGILSVLWVVENRAAKSGRLIANEILRPLQFSSFNENDPNRAALLKAHLIDGPSWKLIDGIAALLEAGLTRDPTHGATHYYAHNIVDPPWGARDPRFRVTLVHGNHTFGIAA